MRLLRVVEAAISVMMIRRGGGAVALALESGRLRITSSSTRSTAFASLPRCRSWFVSQQENFGLPSYQPTPTALSSFPSVLFSSASYDVVGNDDTSGFFADPSTHPTFESIGIQSPALLDRLECFLSPISGHSPEGGVRPSAVQASTYDSISSGCDVTIGAETGSGKTLAYLLPLIDDILDRKHKSPDGYLGYDYARAIILVPNKELVAQVVRMASELSGGRERCVIWEGGSTPKVPFGFEGGGEIDTEGDKGQDEGSATIREKDIVRLAVMPGGLDSPKDFRPFRMALTDPLNHPPVDIIVTTPASIGPLALSPKNIDMFADVRTVVIDEASC